MNRIFDPGLTASGHADAGNNLRFADRLRVLMVLTDGFGGFGGIAKFNRDFLSALDDSGMVEKIEVLPRLVSQPVREAIPPRIVVDWDAANSKSAYMRKMISRLGFAPAPDFVVCGHINLLPAAWLAARRFRARLVLIVHGLEAWTPPRRRLTQMLSRGIDSLIVVSRFSAERFSAWSGFPVGKAMILPNCVDLDRFSPGPREPELVRRYSLQHNKVLLSLGRLRAEDGEMKGVDRVIEVMPQLLRHFPDILYLVVGDGTDRQRLEKLACETGVSDRVVFTGRIEESQKLAHYNLADVFVMPSLTEGFGIVLIEAAACGLPVIGSSRDGSGEALLHGRLGTLVDPGKPDQLVAAVMASLKANLQRSRNPAVQEFDVEHFRRRVHAWISDEARRLRPALVS